MLDPSNGDITFDLPPEHEAGVYANALLIWHTPYEFTIDFAASQYPGPSDPADLEAPSAALIVARVRIPPALAFQLMQMMNGRMADYEAEWGEIVHPRRRGEEDER